MVTKAQAFAADAKTAGWDVKISKKGSREVVKASHDKYGAELKMVWDENVYTKETYNESGITVDGQRRTIRNASEARRILAGEALPKANGKRPAASTRAMRRGRKAEPPPEPADERPARRQRTWGEDNRSKPDAEIRRKVVGKTIVWINTISGLQQEATVLPNADQKQLRVEFTHSKRRIITFASRGGGFVSVYVDSIVELR